MLVLPVSRPPPPYLEERPVAAVPFSRYASIQQFISRVGHPDPCVVELVVKALVTIAAAHTREALWSVAQLFASIHNEARRKAGARVRAKQHTRKDARAHTHAWGKARRSSRWCLAAAGGKAVCNLDATAVRS